MKIECTHRYSHTGVKHAFEMAKKLPFGKELHPRYRSLCGTTTWDRSTREHDNPTTICVTCDRKERGKQQPAKNKKTPWQKIRDAADRGSGVTLTSDDILRLSQDTAIMTRADRDDHGED